MFSKTARALAIPAIAIAMFAAACGNDDPNESGPASGTSEEAPVSGRFLVDPNARLVFDGQTYRLLTMVQRDLIAEDGLAPVGDIESATVATGGQAYRAEGHDSALFTLATVTDEANPEVPTWLQWELVQS